MPRLPAAFSDPIASLSAVSLSLVLSLSAATHASDADADFEQVMAAQMAVWTEAGMNAQLLEQVSKGAEIFATTCAVCHGDLGEGGSGYAQPIINTHGLDKFRTAQRLYLYNRDIMPFNDPGSLPQEEVWQVTAWLMAMNGWLNDVEGPLGSENARRVTIAD